MQNTHADSGTSNNVFMTFSLNDSWYLSSYGNYSTKEGLGQFSLSYADLTLGKKLNKNWAVEAGYRAVWLDIGGETRQIHRPLVNIKWKTKVNDWFLLNRTRFEWREFQEDQFEDRLRIRNHSLAVSPYKIPGTSAKWFIENEVFYEPATTGYNMNWLTTGFRYTVNESTTLKLGYRWQAQKRGGHWKSRNVLVTGIYLNF